MGYSVKKAGVEFSIKIDLGSDATGLAGNFSAVVVNDATKLPEAGAVIGSFTEFADIAGTYSVPVTIPNVGDYTVSIINSTDGFGHASAPVVVTNATIDDVFNAVDTLEASAAAILAEVEGLDGESLKAVKDNVQAIKDMLNNRTATVTFEGVDESANFTVGEVVTGASSGALGTVASVAFDGTDTIVELWHVVGDFIVGEELTSASSTTGSGLDVAVYGNTSVDTVTEFVNHINEALADGVTGLAALKGYTDDIENMLLGTEFLADGTTPNPFFDAVNAGVAKESTIVSSFTALQASIANGIVAINAHTSSLIGTSADTVAGTLFGDLFLVKGVVDANLGHLTNAGYGLEALKGLIDTAQASIDSLTTDVSNGFNAQTLRFDSIDAQLVLVLAELTDGTHGLSAIKTLLDSMDSKLDSIEGKVDFLKANVSYTKVFV